MEGEKVEILSTKRHVKFSIIHSSGNYHIFPSFLSLLKSLLRLTVVWFGLVPKSANKIGVKTSGVPTQSLMRPFNGEVTLSPWCNFNRKMVSIQWIKKPYLYLRERKKKSSCLLNRNVFEHLTTPWMLDWPQIWLLTAWLDVCWGFEMNKQVTEKQRLREKKYQAAFPLFIWVLHVWSRYCHFFVFQSCLGFLAKVRTLLYVVLYTQIKTSLCPGEFTNQIDGIKGD